MGSFDGKMVRDKFTMKKDSPVERGCFPSDWRSRLVLVLVDKVIPFGVFVLLTGMFWVGNHGSYPKLFYWFLALPSLLLAIVQPRSFARILGSRIIVVYFIFAFYISLSVFWSSAGEDALELIKRPLLVCLLFFSVFELAQCRFDLLRVAVRWSAIFSAVAALITIARFAFEGGHGRLAGYGALYNPLLVSHVFGFFIALWFGFYFMERTLFHPMSLFGILVCGVLLLATGSRTPLVAILFTVGWLAALSANRKAALVLGLLLLLGVGVVVFVPEVITQRGLSYRTEIWANALRQIVKMAWFGHGYGSPLSIQLDSFPYPFSDPHNITLRVFYDGGVIGLILWLSLYGVALERSWHFRNDKWVLLCSAAVVYGLAAGLTEGGAFLSRPKEHWFLIWIPLALLSATIDRGRADGQES